MGRRFLEFCILMKFDINMSTFLPLTFAFWLSFIIGFPVSLVSFCDAFANTFDYNLCSLFSGLPEPLKYFFILKEFATRIHFRQFNSSTVNKWYFNLKFLVIRSFHKKPSASQRFFSCFLSPKILNCYHCPKRKDSMKIQKRKFSAEKMQYSIKMQNFYTKNQRTWVFADSAIKAEIRINCCFAVTLNDFGIFFALRRKITNVIPFKLMPLCAVSGFCLKIFIRLFCQSFFFCCVCWCYSFRWVYKAIQGLYSF